MQAKRFALLAIASVVAGCAASGPRYADYAESLPEIPPASTRVTVFRAADSLQYAGRSATVKIDGRELGTCDHAGYQVFYVRAGPHVLTAGMWDAPGTCRVSAHLLGGEDYFFEIAPRAENWTAGLLGAVVGAMGGGAAAAGGPFAAMGFESAGNECGGAFSIVSVEEGAARRKLWDLHLSR